MEQDICLLLLAGMLLGLLGALYGERLEKRQTERARRNLDGERR